MPCIARSFRPSHLTSIELEWACCLLYIFSGDVQNGLGNNPSGGFTQFLLVSLPDSFLKQQDGRQSKGASPFVSTKVVQRRLARRASEWQSSLEDDWNEVHILFQPLDQCQKVQRHPLFEGCITYGSGIDSIKQDWVDSSWAFICVEKNRRVCWWFRCVFSY